MTDLPQHGLLKGKRRGRYYVHTIQKTYAVYLGALLFTYSVALFGLAFVAPYVMPAITLISSGPLEEREIAATQFLVLGQTIWPAIVVLILACAAFSIYLTHRLAGPLYRLEQTAKELVGGNLSLRIRLRKEDQLQELAEVANEALENLEQAFGEIRAREANSRGALRQVVDEMRVQPAADHGRLETLEKALKEGEQIDAVLQRFRFSDPR